MEQSLKYEVQSAMDMHVVAYTAFLVSDMHLRYGRHRLFDLVPKEHTGPPSYYVVHAWGAPFLTLLEQISHHLTPPGMSQIHMCSFVWPGDK